MNGQVIKETFYVMRTDATTAGQLQPAMDTGCDFELPALAELEPTDDLFNDKTSIIWFFNDLYTSARIYLQKKVAGVWVDQSELTDNTYGTMYPLAFFTNKFNERALGYIIEWTKILNDLGVGIYRVRSTSVKSIGSAPDQFSFEFKLQVYTPGRADTTTRIEWTRNGVLGNTYDDMKIDDYGTLTWYNQLRIPNSTFGFDTGEVTREQVKYPNGEQVWISDEQEEELTWNVYLLPAFVHKFLRSDFMMCGSMTMTDYNSQVPTKNISRLVKPSSGYKPEWQMRTDKANVTVTFNPYFENLTHKRE